MAAAGVQGRGRGAEGRAVPVASSDARASGRGGVGEEGVAHLEDRGAGAWNLPVGTGKGAAVRGLVSSPVAGPGGARLSAHRGVWGRFGRTPEAIFAKCQAHSRCSAGAGRDPRPGSHPNVFSPWDTLPSSRSRSGQTPPSGSSPGRGLGPSPHRPRPDAPLGHTRNRPGHLGPHHRPVAGIPSCPCGPGRGPELPTVPDAGEQLSPREPHAGAATPRAGALGANRPGLDPNGGFTACPLRPCWPPAAHSAGPLPPVPSEAHVGASEPPSCPQDGSAPSYSPCL